MYSGIQLELTRAIVDYSQNTHSSRTCDFLKTLYVDVLLQDHIRECSKCPVTCLNNCGVSIPRGMVRVSVWPLWLTCINLVHCTARVLCSQCEVLKQELNE